jgi:hypothetical protein
VFKKHLCFLPGLPFGCQMGRWSLPQTEMQTLATCVRKLARLLWTLHLTFQEVHPYPTPAAAVTPEPMQLCHDLSWRPLTVCTQVHGIHVHLLSGAFNNGCMWCPVTAVPVSMSCCLATHVLKETSSSFEPKQQYSCTWCRNFAPDMSCVSRVCECTGI